MWRRGRAGEMMMDGDLRDGSGGKEQVPRLMG